MINILNAANRYKAAAIHLGLSATVAALAALLVFAVWYPWPYREMAGGQQLFVLIVSVDLMTGPLLTLVAFNRAKRRDVLRRDLIVIVTLQLIALAYGLHTMFVARPVALAFEQSRFRVVSDVDVVHAELPQAPEGLRSLPLNGPRLLGTREPKDGAEKLKAIDMALGGADVGQRPSFWQPYALSAPTAAARARPLALFYRQHAASAAVIDAAVAKSGRSRDQLKFMPVNSMHGDWSVLLDASSGAVVGFVPLTGYF